MYVEGRHGPGQMEGMGVFIIAVGVSSNLLAVELYLYLDNNLLFPPCVALLLADFDWDCCCHPLHHRRTATAAITFGATIGIGVDQIGFLLMLLFGSLLLNDLGGSELVPSTQRS